MFCQDRLGRNVQTGKLNKKACVSHRSSSRKTTSTHSLLLLLLLLLRWRLALVRQCWRQHPLSPLPILVGQCWRQHLRSCGSRCARSSGSRSESAWLSSCKSNPSDKTRQDKNIGERISPPKSVPLESAPRFIPRFFLEQVQGQAGDHRSGGAGGHATVLAVAAARGGAAGGARAERMLVPTVSRDELR